MAQRNRWDIWLDNAVTYPCLGFLEGIILERREEEEEKKKKGNL